MIIDGYEAIKEGRTVYVNAANISDQGTPDPSDDILYTNIYLMSYNQDADPETIEIVKRMLQHWGFNTDLQDVGKCVDAEGNLGDVCLIDPECPKGEYCSSDKANVTRDTKRLEDLAEIKIALKAYKDQHNRYPDLSSGSYLPNKTISTWPSWQDTLAQELNVDLPTDPMNRLGDCGDDRFNSITCWDEQFKEFADSDLTDPALNLPVCSNVYVYTATANGASYGICGVMEADYLSTLEQGACAGSAVHQIGATENYSPVFTGANLPISYSGYEYAGYIKAIDPDGDALTWSINTLGTTWTNWSAPPALENTPVENQKSVKADSAGNAGTYSFQVTINDGRGGVTTATYTITINSLCGDGKVQSPNDEYSGGPANDGYEQCDINDHVAQSPEESALNGWHYECTGICEVGQADCTGTCSWDGGYCGDGVVQDGHGEECDINETKADYESRTGIAVDSATWTAIQNVCDNCSMSCVDRDGDGYGYPTNLNCAYTELDCEDRAEGADGIPGTLDDGANINPDQPDDCTQYDGIDNDCDGQIDEHADTSNVLTNIDFELPDISLLPPGNHYPTDWSGAGQVRANVGLTQAEARSGIQSVAIEQDANLEYPGTCTQTICENPGMGKCTWLAGTSQCQMNGPDTCHPVPPYIYNQGETLCWGNSHRVMWANLVYNVSTLPFEVGDLYIVRFYYKGNVDFGNRMSTRFTYSIGSGGQCYSKTTYPWWICGWGFSADCPDRPTHCCYHVLSAANQTNCYTSASIPSVQDNNYPDWTLHSGSFVYSTDLAKLLDDSGNRRHEIGIAVGYNSTGPAGSQVYIDDFQLLECNNIP